MNTEDCSQDLVSHTLGCLESHGGPSQADHNDDLREKDG